jgi:hypothetical protein
MMETATTIATIVENSSRARGKNENGNRARRSSRSSIVVLVRNRDNESVLASRRLQDSGSGLEARLRAASARQRRQGMARYTLGRLGG